MKYSTSIITLLNMATMVSAHGYIVSPLARKPGNEFAAKCSKQLLSQQSSDINGNIQGELQITANQKDYNAAECNLWLCKGFQFADNQANVQTYTAGQVVPITVNIAAPHTGTANVSIVDGKTGQALSTALKSWDVYASNSSPVPDSDKNFNITIPDLGGKCATPGDCVIQWTWDAHSISQTYQACVDFTQGGSSKGSSTGSSPGLNVSSSTRASVASTFSTVVGKPTSRPNSTSSSTSAPSASVPAAPASSVSPTAVTSGAEVTYSMVAEWVKALVSAYLESH